MLPRIFSGRMEDFGLPTPNHNFLDAHPTVSSELLGRLGSGDAVAKGDVAELLGDRVRFADGSRRARRRDHLRDRLQGQLPVLRPGLPPRAGERAAAVQADAASRASTTSPSSASGQPIPTIFPFAELQSKLAARWLSGDWAPPARAEMEAEIVSDEAFHTGHFVDKPRHTMQLEWYSYKRELEQRTIPDRAGSARAPARTTGRDAAGRAAALGAGPPAYPVAGRS